MKTNLFFIFSKEKKIALYFEYHTTPKHTLFARRVTEY